MIACSREPGGSLPVEWSYRKCWRVIHGLVGKVIGNALLVLATRMCDVARMVEPAMASRQKLGRKLCTARKRSWQCAIQYYKFVDIVAHLPLLGLFKLLWLSRGQKARMGVKCAAAVHDYFAVILQPWCFTTVVFYSASPWDAFLLMVSLGSFIGLLWALDPRCSALRWGSV